MLAHHSWLREANNAFLHSQHASQNRSIFQSIIPVKAPVAGSTRIFSYEISACANTREITRMTSTIPRNPLGSRAFLTGYQEVVEFRDGCELPICGHVVKLIIVSRPYGVGSNLPGAGWSNAMKLF